MKIKIIICLLLIGVVTSTNANAWFFFFIPGSATRSISDAVTGAKGNICVKESAKEGDILTSPNGNTAKILSTSGTSSICKNPATPIRADIEFTFKFNSKAGIDIPEDYENVPLTDLERYNGNLLKVKSKSLKNSGFIVTSTTKRPDFDIKSWANNIDKYQQSNPNLLNAKTIAPEEITIKGMRALRFQVQGTLKGVFGDDITYLYTLIEGDNELVNITFYQPTAKFNLEEAEKISMSIQGLNQVTEIGSTQATVNKQAAEIKTKSDFDENIKKCSDIGFKPGTEAFGNCVLKLSK
jgi:hypothetical protein